MNTAHLLNNSESLEGNVDINSNIRGLERLLENETNVLVFFYTRWCPDCVKFYGEGITTLSSADGIYRLELFQEMNPKLLGKVKKYKVIFVNVGSKRQWKKTLKVKHDGQEYEEPNEVGSKNHFRKEPYSINSVPSVLFYDKGKKQSWQPVGVENIREQFYRYLTTMFAQ